MPFVSKRTFEEQLEQQGFLLYGISGTSMMPLLRQKTDVVLIEPIQNKIRARDVVLYRRDNGQYVLHRVLKIRKDDYVICGDHQYHPEYGITERHILGVMTAVIRDGVKLDITDLRYGIYVHLWCDLFYLRAGILRMKSLLWYVKRKWKKWMK